MTGGYRPGNRSFGSRSIQRQPSSLSRSVRPSLDPSVPSGRTGERGGFLGLILRGSYIRFLLLARRWLTPYGRDYEIKSLPKIIHNQVT